MESVTNNRWELRSPLRHVSQNTAADAAVSTVANHNAITTNQLPSASKRPKLMIAKIKKIQTEHEFVIADSGKGTDTEQPLLLDTDNVDDEVKDSTGAFSYPMSGIPKPSRSLIQTLYELAEPTDDQQTLTEAGILSLQHVLLPAIAYQEDQVLKQVQAKVQRDCPDQKPVVEQCRKAVYDCISVAMHSVQLNRQARRVQEMEREQQWESERELAREQQRQEEMRLAERQAQERELARIKRKAELAKKLPRNQALWREMVYLMTEISKLEKEERLWNEAQDKINEQLNHVCNLKEMEPSINTEHADSRVVTSCPVLDSISQSVQDITLATTRIQQALHVVDKITAESDQVRRDLYNRYRMDHQFHGYQGVKDPKGLLRALSQSQDLD